MLKHDSLNNKASIREPDLNPDDDELSDVRIMRKSFCLLHNDKQPCILRVRLKVWKGLIVTFPACLSITYRITSFSKEYDTNDRKASLGRIAGTADCSFDEKRSLWCHFHAGACCFRLSTVYHLYVVPPVIHFVK